MRRFIFILLLVCLPVAQAEKNKRQPKEPEIEVLESSAHRADDRLAVDGKLRNTGEKPVRKLRLIFEVLDADRNILTRQTGAAEDGDLEPSQESEFHVQMGAHARAVQVRLAFEDGSGRDIRGIKAGPFPIE